jgi:hypothetical protein
MYVAYAEEYTNSSQSELAIFCLKCLMTLASYGRHLFFRFHVAEANYGCSLFLFSRVCWNSAMSALSHFLSFITDRYIDNRFFLSSGNRSSFHRHGGGFCPGKKKSV